MSTITYEDFQKLDIRIGKIESVEKVENADKLLKLIIDLGNEKRQVISGIAEFYPDFKKLEGKLIPVLVNLEPRVIRGLESQGMILAADVAGKAVLLQPHKKVPAGSKVR